jgi:hypothetical protein
MSTSYLEKISKKKNIAMDKVEELWDKAKELAKEKNHDEDYAYITGIFKKMVGESLSFKEFQILSEDDAPTMSVSSGGTAHHSDTDGKRSYMGRVDRKKLLDEFIKAGKVK